MLNVWNLFRKDYMCRVFIPVVDGVLFREVVCFNHFYLVLVDSVDIHCFKKLYEHVLDEGGKPRPP